MEDWHYFIFSAIFLSVWFKKRWFSYLLLHSLYCDICCFGRSVWRKSNLTKTSSWKNEKYLIYIFLDNCGYSFLILHQNSTNGDWLKVRCKVESETVWMTSLYSITFKPIGLTLWKALLPMSDFVRSYIDH